MALAPSATKYTYILVILWAMTIWRPSRHGLATEQFSLLYEYASLLPHNVYTNRSNSIQYRHSSDTVASHHTHYFLKLCQKSGALLRTEYKLKWISGCYLEKNVCWENYWHSRALVPEGCVDPRPGGSSNFSASCRVSLRSGWFLSLNKYSDTISRSYRSTQSIIIKVTMLYSTISGIECYTWC